MSSEQKAQAGDPPVGWVSGVKLERANESKRDAMQENRKLREALKACVEALKNSKTALDAWTHTYAEELCDSAYVEEAKRRIEEGGGTLAYIADAVESNINAIQKAQEAIE